MDTQDHIGSSKPHSQLNNKMNSKPQVQHRFLLLCSTGFWVSSTVSSKEKYKFLNT